MKKTICFSIDEALLTELEIYCHDKQWKSKSAFVESLIRNALKKD